jgi:hypothetical protein
MKYLAAVLCAMGLWVNLPLDAGAVESPERVGLSADASRMAQAADRPAAGIAAPRRGLTSAPRRAAEHARSSANNSHSSLGQSARGRVENSVSRPIPPKLKIVPGGSTLGGPRVTDPGRLGGLPGARGAKPAVINGVQLHRKF